MKNRRKIIGMLCTVAVLLQVLTSVVPLSAAAKPEAVFTIEDGDYAIVISGIKPTGGVSGSYYCMHTAFLYQEKMTGLSYQLFSKDGSEPLDYWHFEKNADGTYWIQNPNLGAEGYLNIEASRLYYGTNAQSTARITVTCDSGAFTFSRVIDGKTYYIRFTNGSSTGGPHFESGTSLTSYQYVLYRDGEDVIENLPTSEDADQPLPKEEPEFVIACISDLHTDYYMQNEEPYVRESVIRTVEYLHETGNVDVLLVGGDMTSDNQGVRAAGGWTQEIFANVFNAFADILPEATKEGYTLFACGNHDYQAGSEEGYDSYSPFVDMEIDAVGEPISVHRQKDDEACTQNAYPEFVLGIHFRIGRFDFITLNAPYASSLYYTADTLTWLDRELKTIGKENTVFVFGHYPLADSRNLSTETYGISGSNY